jgi:monooxygenase
MSHRSRPTTAGAEPLPDEVDFLIIGAGLSGIGAAAHFKRAFPDKTFAIVEARDASGGTWDLFRYPGVRSDSDLYTFGYAFEPWRDDKAIADGSDILTYIRGVAARENIDERIWYRLRATEASWDSGTARWSVTLEDSSASPTAASRPTTIRSRFLFCASGYYRYDEPFSPDLAGLEDFEGALVHPQFWPDDLDYAGKNVVVIGSGATAITLVPAMAERAGHVTMLQRSPTYIMSLPAKDGMANFLKRILPTRLAYDLVRRKNVTLQAQVYKLCRKYPRLARKLIRRATVKKLPAGVDVDVHFKPRYEPWDQRLCMVPDGDLFDALADGSASIVTDRIKTFTSSGLLLESGQSLEADVVVTATGLSLLAFGGLDLVVDGEPVNLQETLVYKGCMLGDVPNFAFAVGYTNASWTLKVDLVCEYVNRVLRELEGSASVTCVPKQPNRDGRTRPLLDFAAGYVQRSVDQFPRQGEAPPWSLNMSYKADVRLLRRGAVRDGVLSFGPAPKSPSLAFVDTAQIS